jgi:hypothetical protein
MGRFIILVNNGGYRGYSPPPPIMSQLRHLNGYYFMQVLIKFKAAATEFKGFRFASAKVW